MKEMNQLKAGALLSYINIAVGSIIPLFYTPVMLGILGKEEYGLYSLSQSIISYLSLLNLGMGSAVMRYVTKCRAENDIDGVKSITGLFTIIYVALGFLVLVAGAGMSLFAEQLFSQGLTNGEVDRLKVLMVIMTMSTAVSFPVSVFSSVCVAYEKYVFRRMLDITLTVLAPVLNLIVLFGGGKSVGMAVVGLVLQVVSAPVFICYCHRRLGIKPKFKKVPKEVLWEIWSFSAFVFLSMIVDLLYWATDKVLIGAILGSVAVAIYNVGSVFTSMMQNMASAISNVFVPRITAMVITGKNTREISDVMIRVGRLQYLIVALILSGYIVFGQQFIQLWLGDDYLPAYAIAVFTMVPLAVPLIQNVAYNTILAQKNHQFRAIVYAVIAVLNLISTYLVLPAYGIVGAAACTGVAFVIGNGIIMNIYYAKVTKLEIGRFWINIGQMSVVPCVMILVGYRVTNVIATNVSVTLFDFLIQVVVYLVVYSIATWVFTMNDYEKHIILGLINKKRRGV